MGDLFNGLAHLWNVETAATATFLTVLVFVIRLWNGSPAMFAQWIEYRKVRAAEKSALWTRLRDEAIRLGEAEEKCRTELADVQRRLSALEGYRAGYGRAHQEAAAIVALERKDRP